VRFADQSLMSEAEMKNLKWEIFEVRSDFESGQD